jgi:Spy/CpxP family protein refolding chaperone
MFRKYLLCAALVTGACTASAQSSTSTAPRPTPEQQHHNQQMVQAALQVIQLVDQNHVAQVWDGASTGTKQIVNRDTFVRSVDADRKRVGAPEARKLTALT